jgi:tetratricopeptide (TPR) repeat protein
MKRCIGSFLVLSFVLHPLIGQDRRKAQFYFEAGEKAYLEGKYTQALEHFDKCLVVNAGYYDAYPSRAAVKERIGDWSGAVTDYSIYLDKYPENKEALFSRGLARYNAQQFESALADFKYFLKLPPGGETQTIFYRQSPLGGGTDHILSAQGSIRDYLFNYIGLAQYRMKRYQESIVSFDSAIYINPNDADYYVHRGLASQASGNLREAESDYRKALELDPEHAIAYYNLGILLGEQGDNAAESQLDQAIERNPGVSYPYLERGHSRLKRGDFTGALSDYNQALNLDSTNPDSWVDRGLVKDKLNDGAGAYADFTRAIEIKPDFEKAWLCRGNILTKMNRFEEAAEDYSVALLYFPQYGKAYLNRAIVYHRLGKMDEACADVRKAESFGMKDTQKLKDLVCR